MTKETTDISLGWDIVELIKAGRVVTAISTLAAQRRIPIIKAKALVDSWRIQRAEKIGK